ncbi:MAG: hypothetical protein H6716_02815 [Polyangiaceae bacterium]|nr:hypothetical protein [Polyangiaceae bacterium]
MKHVRGSLFVDYVRLIRSRKDIDWNRYLEPDDLAYLKGAIEDQAWYPLETFERLGVAILNTVAQGSISMVRVWGHLQVDAMLRIHPEVLAPGDAYESLHRVIVHRKGYFDFDVLTAREVLDDHASFELNYAFSDLGELAACMQTLGAFEELVKRAGGKQVDARFTERRWEGDRRTLFLLSWV